MRRAISGDVTAKKRNIEEKDEARKRIKTATIAIQMQSQQVANGLKFGVEHRIEEDAETEELSTENVLNARNGAVVDETFAQFEETGRDEDKDWGSQNLEGRALFVFNNAYRRLNNYDKYEKQLIYLKILNSIVWSGRNHCYANIHHDGVVCTICQNDPSIETTKKAKSRWQGEGDYKHWKTVLGLGTHIRCSHKIRLNFPQWVEARDALSLQWNDEIFIRFERCQRRQHSRQRLFSLIINDCVFFS